MRTRPMLFALMLAGLIGSAHADDHKNCADETNPGHRKQCERAAAAHHVNKSSHGNMACADCGRVTGVNVSEKSGDSNALGLLAGGAAGALLGHQVGGGSGKDIATIAGAVGGAYAGKKIQEKANSSKIWTVHVQYDNGNRRSFEFERDPGLHSGDHVRNAGASIARN
jgi:outer membrane lipoprotein SlyB